MIKIYNIINCNSACFHSINNGPCFGDGELFIVDNCFKEYSITSNESNCYNFNDINLIGQKEVSTFIVKEYEVYQVIFHEW